MSAAVEFAPRALRAQYPDLEKTQCETSLYTFTRRAWKIVEPRSRFIKNWHIEAICHHLEAVTRGEILNLLITMPPRHMKSLLVSVMWPCWVWARQPWTRWLYASYAQPLATRDSVKCRRIMMTNWYQGHWGDRVTLTGDQNLKMRFENTATGYRIATSVGGAVTGEGGDVVVVDDPHNVSEGESDAIRESTVEWWRETMSTRLNSASGAKVIVQQRVHEYDLAGSVIEEGSYVHLNIPNEYEAASKCRVEVTGFADPREEEGELLWPARFDAAWVERQKLALGDWGYATQYQQHPAPRAGGMFKIDKFVIVDALPSPIVETCRGWDKGGSTTPGAAYSAGSLVARLQDGRFAVLDVIRNRWLADDREAAILSCAIQDGRDGYVWIEQEPGSGGKESAQGTVKRLAGFKAFHEQVTGSKEARATPYSVQVNAGNVLLLRGSWNTPFISEHRNFPSSKYKDQVDATSGAFNFLARRIRPNDIQLESVSRLSPWRT